MTHGEGDVGDCGSQCLDYLDGIRSSGGSQPKFESKTVVSGRDSVSRTFHVGKRDGPDKVQTCEGTASLEEIKHPAAICWSRTTADIARASQSCLP